MRVLDCDHCRQTLTAANDEELARIVADHFASEHDRSVPIDEAESLVRAKAYDAMDS